MRVLLIREVSYVVHVAIPNVETKGVLGVQMNSRRHVYIYTHVWQLSIWNINIYACFILKIKKLFFIFSYFDLFLLNTFKLWIQT